MSPLAFPAQYSWAAMATRVTSCLRVTRKPSQHHYLAPTVLIQQMSHLLFTHEETYTRVLHCFQYTTDHWYEYAWLHSPDSNIFIISHLIVRFTFTILFDTSTVNNKKFIKLSWYKLNGRCFNIGVLHSLVDKWRSWRNFPKVATNYGRTWMWMGN